MTEKETARFEELKQIRAARDEKYLVNQDPGPFANEGKQVIVPRSQK